MAKYKIVTDSSADIFTLENTAFASAPMKIITAEREFTDDENLNAAEMVEFLLSYKGKSSTSCPNAHDWLETFGDADYVFCFSITSTLSGGYNAALNAKSIYEEQHPEKHVFVFDTLTTGPEMALLIEYTEAAIARGEDFDTISAGITEYSKSTGLLFMLQSMKNLANNGRVKPLVAKAAGILGIRATGVASAKGDLEMVGKSRGEDKALTFILERIKMLGYCGHKIRITHVVNPEGAEKLMQLVKSEFPDADASIRPCRGLCSFYAEKGGLLVGFEKA